jgi:hypothetical protein
MGGDGHYCSVYRRVSRDVYALKLEYFTRDYQPIGGTGAPAFSSLTYTAPTTLQATGNELFNGNISYTTLALSKIGAGLRRATPTATFYLGDSIKHLRLLDEHYIDESSCLEIVSSLFEKH